MLNSKSFGDLQAGQKDVFVEGLPGYPDGLTEGSEGTYWLSLVSLKNPALAAFMRYRSGSGQAVTNTSRCTRA